MNYSENDNIYEFNAMNVLAKYAEYVEGSPSCLVVVCSRGALGADARHAIAASCEKLDIGECAWVTTGARPDGAGPDVTGSGGASVGGAGAGDMPAAGISAGSTGAEDGSAAGISAEDLFVLVEGLDPSVLIATDEASAAALGEAYGCAIPADVASRVFGRTCVAFRDFEGMLQDGASKQRAWALLKQLK